MCKPFSARRRAARLIAAAAALCLFGPSAGTATTIVAKDLPALCAEADLIFEGTVTNVVSQPAGDTGMDIETLVTFAVNESLLGAGDRETTLRFSGGQVGTIRQEVAGVPRFTPGDRVVIFARSGRSVSPIVGFNQGVFRIAESPAGPVVLNAEREPLADVRDGRLAFGAAADKGAAAIPLPAFLDTVRAQLTKRRESEAR